MVQERIREKEDRKREESCQEMVERLANMLSSFIICLVWRINGLDVKSCSDGGKLIEVWDCPPAWGAQWRWGPLLASLSKSEGFKLIFAF